MEDIYDLAIVGSGPAGISSSVEAVILGIKKIILFEKAHNHSQTIRRYFKDDKRVDRNWKGLQVELKGHIHFTDGTKESTIDLFDTLIKDNHIEACFNEEVYSVEKIDDHFKINTSNNKTVFAKNVVIAIGNRGKPNKPDYIVPHSLKQKTNYNIAECKGNEKILIVGGGDSAVEFAYYTAKQNRVTLSYRKEGFTKVNPTNLHNIYDFATQGLINLKFGSDIEKVENNNGQPEVYFTNADVEKYDRIIFALGGSNPIDFLQRCCIHLDEEGKAIVDENFRNNQDGLYLAGDVTGDKGGSISLALNHGYIIINHIKETNRA